MRCWSSSCSWSLIRSLLTGLLSARCLYGTNNGRLHSDKWDCAYRRCVYMCKYKRGHTCDCTTPVCVCVCVCVCYSWVSNPLEGPIVRGFLQKYTRRNRGKGGSLKSEASIENEHFGCKNNDGYYFVKYKIRKSLTVYTALTPKTCIQSFFYVKEDIHLSSPEIHTRNQINPYVFAALLRGSSETHCDPNIDNII